MKILNKVFEIKDEHGGINAINPLGSHLAAARGNMGSNQLGKTIAVDGLEVPMILTGHEKSLISGLKQALVEGEIRVLDIVHKVLKGKRITSHIFFMDENEKIDVIEVPDYENLNGKTAFRHKPTDLFDELEPNDILNNPVFSTTPSNIDEYNGYGINLDIVYANVNEIGEDAIIINESTCDKFAFEQTKTFTISKSKFEVFKNIYGSDNVWKGFPDVGDEIRDDGVLYELFDLKIGGGDNKVSNEKEEQLMSYKNYDNLRSDFLKEPSPLDDGTIYSKGVVIDIEVITQPVVKKPTQLKKVNDQVDYYRDECVKHKKALCKAYMNICREYGSGLWDTSLNFSPEVGTLIDDAFTYYDASAEYGLKRGKRGIKRVNYNKRPIDTIIKITILYKRSIGKGFKLSDIHGAKQIVGMVLPDKDMPCDCILNPLASSDRTIPSRLIESFFSGVTRDVREEALLLGKEKGLEYIKGFFDIVSPDLSKALRDTDATNRDSFYQDLKENNMHIHRRFQDTDFTEVFNALRNSVYAKNKIEGILRLPGIPDIDLTGLTTKGNLYTMLLDNLPSSCMATDKPRVNALGLAPSTSKIVKNKYPYNVQASKILSEPETKIIASYASPELIAELRDRVSVLPRQSAQCKALLTAKDPANIEVLLDRKKFPFVPGIGTVMMNAIFITGGFKLTHSKLIKKGK